MPGADAATFEYLNSAYSKDKNNFYSNENRINGADLNRIEIIGYGISKDKNNVYYENFKIEDADPPTFEVLVCGNKVNSKPVSGKCAVEYGDKNYIYKAFLVKDNKLEEVKRIKK